MNCVSPCKHMCHSVCLAFSGPLVERGFGVQWTSSRGIRVSGLSPHTCKLHGRWAGKEMGRLSVTLVCNINVKFGQV